MKEIEVEGTLSSITASLTEVAVNFKTLWFRGQPTYGHKLLPSIFRQGPSFGVIYHEQKMLQEFKRRYPDQSNTHKDTYEWLTLMQHYGLPTRLLDWSSNLLVGLYFSCINDLDCDGSLFIFDPTYLHDTYELNEFLEMQVQEKSRADFFQRLIYRLDEELDGSSKLNGISIQELRSNIFKRSPFCGLSTGSSASFDSLELKVDLENTKDINGKMIPFVFSDVKRAFSNIVPFKAPHLNPRIRQQHGYFTFHGGMFVDGDEFIPVGELENEMYSGDSLIKMRIRKETKLKLLKELEYAGIKESTLFPEMEYQAREIKKLYSLNY
ncbi:FRG domain-containing protein [Pantoea sp. B9002]|uniref:FRG domain-containing protein n=1 Tax=Pantoea sp. B9002 TaxID=2726979 RepID=UPI0015A04994|nr:FRG domain-containing protein [Pantoea sp. B9002]NWA59671.1 FRG domain-containing protein [Pantoea sp. B9002]